MITYIIEVVLWTVVMYPICDIIRKSLRILADINIGLKREKYIKIKTKGENRRIK